MTTQIQIESRQRFTILGTVGAWMFLLSPWLAGLGYYAIGRGYSADMASAYATLVLGGSGFLLGIVFMLVGRQYRHDVTINGQRVDPS